jgi:hypothetical protein
MPKGQGPPTGIKKNVALTIQAGVLSTTKNKISTIKMHTADIPKLHIGHQGESPKI